MDSTVTGLGALAVALNNSGVLGTANSAKGALLKSFGALPIPNPPEISTSIPSLFSNTDVVLNISGGKFNPSNLSLSNLQQSSEGNFSIDAILTGTLDFSKWHEDDTTYFSSSGQGLPPPPSHSSFDSTFQITFQSINLTVSVQMKLDASNNIAPNVVGVKVNDKKFNFNLPSQTGLTSSIFDCINKKVKSEISDKIGVMTDGIVSSVHTGLDSAFSVIPESGKLTSDITYLFPGTPGGLLFPNNNGVQYCVLGKVQWKGSNAPGDVGSVPFPPVPTDGHDALFYVNNYSFNALFWAFYKQGDLHFSFNKSNVPVEPMLTTNYYNGTSLQPIYDKYPNRNMIIDLTLNAPPSVQLVANKADITYNALVTFYVAKAGSETEKDAELFSVDLTEIDALETFSVSSNANFLQLITFNVNTIKELSLKVVNSNIPKVDPSTLISMWKFGLQPVYANVLNKASQAGVPLPSSLDGIFTNYAIQIHPGYASAAVNFTSKAKYERVLKRHGIDIPSLTKPHPNLAIM